MNTKINCTCVNLDRFLLFLRNRLDSWPFYMVLRFTVCSVLFSYIKRRQVTVCSLNSQISPASKNCTLIHHESPKSLRPGQCNISSPRRAACGFMFVSANMQFNRVVDMLLDFLIRVRPNKQQAYNWAVNEFPGLFPGLSSFIQLYLLLLHISLG